MNLVHVAFIILIIAGSNLIVFFLTQFFLSKKTAFLQDQIKNNQNEYDQEIEHLNSEIKRLNFIINQSKEQTSRFEHLQTDSSDLIRENDSDEQLQKRNIELNQLEYEKMKIKEKNKRLWDLSLAIHEDKKKIGQLKKEIETKHFQVTSSIQYTQRIQNTILPSNKEIKRYLPQSFILWKPRYIVSGDFYWFHAIDDFNFFIAVVDCTGHGVPGAFMSMIGYLLLNQIVVEEKVYNPAQILENMHVRVRKILKQESGKTMDGMDVGLCKIDIKKNIVTFSGAKRPLLILEKKQQNYDLIKIKGNRKSIGGRQREQLRVFNNHEIQFGKSNQFYLTTDGFIDQFNPQGDKYGLFQFYRFLQSIGSFPLEEQNLKFLQELEDHKKNQEQIDDITIIGFKIR